VGNNAPLSQITGSLKYNKDTEFNVMSPKLAHRSFAFNSARPLWRAIPTNCTQREARSN